MSERVDQLRGWVRAVLGGDDPELELASGDASFRRYFRVRVRDESFIVMDAPPELEDSRPFVRIAREWAAVGLNVPLVQADDLERGFLLLSDLGSRHYLDELRPDNVGRLYGDALGSLVIIQACAPVGELPEYDRRMLLAETEIFREWLLGRFLGLSLDEPTMRAVSVALEYLAEQALVQPRVCVHRDYHSRNLMYTVKRSPGILDFQGAVIGPVTYDLVSLLRDCYVAWPRDQIEGWAAGYFELAVQSGILRPEHEGRFMAWFDLMGVQRHLKAAGIFARLSLRDGKHGYLEDIPRTLGYVADVAQRYPEIGVLGDVVTERVLPSLDA